MSSYPKHFTRGVILAGGTGTRLAPITKQINKHLVPVLNRPMIEYPLATLKHMGITNILIVSGGGHVGGFAEYLGDGSEFGIDITYKVQKGAGGIAQALGLAEDFCGGRNMAVILGDNVFDYKTLSIPINDPERKYAYLYAKEMSGEEARRFGVLRGNAVIEKPEDVYKLEKVVTGLYIYPPDVFGVIKTLRPSARGELEVTDINNYYLRASRCIVNNVPGFWSDAGTVDSLKSAIDWAYNNV